MGCSHVVLADCYTRSGLAVARSLGRLGLQFQLVNATLCRKIGRTKLPNWQYCPIVLCLEDNNVKAKPAKKRGRKAMGPRFLREAKDDSPKVPKMAGLPKHMLRRYHLNIPITDTSRSSNF